LFRFLAVNNQHLADVLDRERVGALADAGQRHFALVAVERGGADFDQLVGGQGAVNFRDDGVGEALFAQLKDRVEVVGAGLEGLALGSGQIVFHERGILAQQKKSPGSLPGFGNAVLLGV
jgi:Ca2+-binding RTX toxin-like protein